MIQCPSDEKKMLIIFILVMTFCAIAGNIPAQTAKVAEPDADHHWRQLAEGLELGTFA